ncbi:MAG: DUF2156 domain-containing protein, partial [Deltaproteobacteria bacterium]|nr:DUF2156 domain-containing protein [Deltaproteobacteria bacterium]
MPSPATHLSERDRALGLVMRHGRLATAFQIIEPGYTYHFDAGGDAVTAFVRINRWRVVCGMPVSSVEALPAVVGRFVADCAAQGERVAFFGVEQPLLDALASAGVAADAVQIAEQPEWDPRQYNTRGGAKQTLRGQINRARNKGVTVRQWHVAPGDDEAALRLREAVADVLERWLSSRRMSIMRFMVNLEPFDYPEHRRYFVAERHGRPIGFLAAVPVPARGGLFFEDVIRAPEAPNGTAELLIHTAFESAAIHGDHYATLGMAPLAGVPGGAGPHRMIRGVLRLCYARLTPLYAFAGLRRFKARFHPDGWVPQYLVTCEGKVGVSAFQAVLRAFAGGGLLSFGWDTGRRLLGRITDRRWRQGLVGLATLLVPWTLLLASVDG